MRIATIVLGLALVAGCQQHRYFVDLDRAVWESADGKRASDGLKADQADKQRRLNEAEAAAKKAEDAKEPDAAAKRQQAAQLGDQLNGELKQAQQRARAALGDKARPALERVAADHHVAVIEFAGAVAWSGPSDDVTAEVSRRMDDIAKASEVDTLKAENERLKAKAKP
jgi:Skp family chaperone for outer membrane proteins